MYSYLVADLFQPKREKVSILIQVVNVFLLATKTQKEKLIEMSQSLFRW